MTIRQVLKRLAIVLLLGPVTFFVLLLRRAFEARSMMPLQAWHAPSTVTDRLTQQDALRADFETYLAAEKQLLDTIYQAHISSNSRQLNRYTSDSLYSPYVGGENLNASFHLFPSGKIKGGILLLHGFQESPYSLRALADLLAQEGYYVLGLRLPGHGTIPGALTDVQWQEWQQATYFGVEMVQQEMAKHEASRFIIGGMSTGGALALNYTLQALATDGLSRPDNLLLFAPGIEIDSAAALSRYTAWLNWMPYFHKFKWNNIKIEYDPFRYYSTPMNGIDQVYRLIQRNNELAAEMASQPGGMAQMPPVIAFQSIVDNTVNADALFDWFERYGTPTSELVLFDINRSLAPFLQPEVVEADPTDILTRPTFQSRLVVVTNQPSPTGGIDSELVKATLYLPDGAGTFTPQELVTSPELRWPDHLTAMSHPSMTISAEDAYRGADPLLIVPHLQGESGIAAISDFNALRLRYNPFFSLLAERVVAVLNEQ